jgi:RND family efflux transporter MFP subunit
LLFTIQQDQYRAQLQQAQAQVSAQKAALAHAQIEFARYSGLELKHAATQTEVDQWRYQTQASAAGVIGAQAQVQIARLNLDYTEVRAPFDGWIGRHLVDPGNLVGTMGKQTVLAQIDQIDPLYVYFTINERDLLRVIKMRRSEGLPIAQPVIPAYFALSDENGFPHAGRLDFASIAVAPTTGTLQVRGIFPNHDHSVLPGLFARVRIKAPKAREALLIPGDAVSFDQQGSYVLVVEKDGVVERRGVKTGFQVGAMIVVEDGLDVADQVIVQGLLQAIPGRKVTPEPAAAVAAPPSASADD